MALGGYPNAVTQIYCFADEAGNFDFRPPETGASRYFILTTVTMRDCAPGHALVDLRRELAMEGADVSRPFHASEDRQVIRDRVFEALAPYDFRVDATILEKRKAQPHVRLSEPRFYQTAWWLHFKHVAPWRSALTAMLSWWPHISTRSETAQRSPRPCKTWLSRQ